MIKTIIGIILLFVPFLLISRFKDKRAGFFYILSFLLGSIFFISFATQIFGIFKYWTVISIFILADAIVLTRINYKELIPGLKNIRINWIFLAMILILFIELYSVHYHYTGTLNTFEGWKEVKNARITYPYFSDEWVSASLAKYSINSGKLPLVNPLWHEAPFPNFNAPFHILISGTAVLLDIEPAREFAIFPLIFGMFICILIYFIFRFNNLGIYCSATICLFVPYLLNGGNLPGLWYFIPVTAGLVFMLLSFVFIALNEKKMVEFNSFLSLVFYPPLVVLVFAYLSPYMFFYLRGKKLRKFGLLFASLLLSGALIFAFVLYTTKNVNTSINSVFGHIFYTSLLNEGIPDFSIFKIVPLVVLFFIPIGLLLSLRKIKERLWLLLPLLVGCIFWLAYSKTISRFLIEYPRIVFATSILIIILAGFGMNAIILHLDKLKSVKKYRIIEILAIMTLIIFFVLSFSYTNHQYWQELKLHKLGSEQTISPAPPANEYFSKADIQLFSEIKEKNFLSYPWKGLAIGAATGNYPLVTKDSMITNYLMDYQKFMKENCANKLKIAKEKDIDYVYLNKIDCPGFKLINISIEDLYLYEVSY